MYTKKTLRDFSLIWSGIFLFIAFWPLIKGESFRIWGLIVSLIFIAIAFIRPEILTSFYKYWTKIGEFIGNIVSKVMLGVLFYLFFTPVAFILRLFGKDLLNKKLDKNKESYWINRETQPESMKNQF